MPADNSMPDVSTLLEAWNHGELAARDEVMKAVYDELRRRARAHIRRERAGHSLPPIALVHETYLRLIDQRGMVWLNRAQFFGVAAQMMRRILVDHARARTMAKRSGQRTRVALNDSLAPQQARRRRGARPSRRARRTGPLRRAQRARRGVAVFRRVVARGSRRGVADLDRNRRTQMVAARAWLYSRLKPRRT